MSIELLQGRLSGDIICDYVWDLRVLLILDQDRMKTDLRFRFKPHRNAKET